MDSNAEQYAAPMTKEESESVVKFIELLKSKKVEYNLTKFDSGYLVRFLRARKLDLNKTLVMFQNFLAWRKEFDIDNIDKFSFPELEKVKVYYPHGFHKQDKQGRPVYLEILGDLRVDEIFKLTSQDKLLKYQAKLFEKLLNEIFPICSKVAKKYIYQTYQIIDLKKLTTKLLSKKVYSFIKVTAANSQNYYPELLGQMTIVNAGLVFKAAWSVCKAFLDEKTRKKIVTLGSDYKKKLLEQVDIKDLPKILGGECVCEPYGCIYSNSGPWNKEGISDVIINPDLIKNLEKATNDNDAPEDNQDLGDINLDDEDNEDKEKLKELSKQLNEQMKLSTGQKAATEYRMENDENDLGETPINTQEVI